MQRGPVDFVLAEFQEGKFHGHLARAIADLVNRDLVRVIDLVFISKDAQGAIDTFEIDSLEPEVAEVYAALDGEVGGLVSDTDLEVAAAGLEPGAAAGILVFENLWARDFLSALEAAGGKVAAQARIPADEVTRAFEGIDSPDQLT